MVGTSLKFDDVDGYKLIIRLTLRAFSHNLRSNTHANHFSTSGDA